MQPLLRSLRIRQWLKNTVVLAPLVFSGKLTDVDACRQAIAALACFCLASSATYLVNDILDRRLDRFHPVKRFRPVASGAVSVQSAQWAAAILLLAAFAISWNLPPVFIRVLAGYFLLTGAYSLWMKRLVILDVMALSGGFLLRVLGGSVAIGVIASHWMLLSMFFLAALISLGKRRQELGMPHAQALRHRAVLADYTVSFIDQLTAILAAVTIVFYALYTVSAEVIGRAGSPGLVATVPFVVYCNLRYLYLMQHRGRLFDPTEVLVTDVSILLSVALWAVTSAWMLYR